jgi:hypothetical protein
MIGPVREISEQEARTDLHPNVTGFIDAVQEAAGLYDLPGYACMVLAPETMVVVAGGFNQECVELLAEANRLQADAIRNLLLLRFGTSGRPS